ncbi:beta-galactosidase, partial [Streptococcus suis]
ERFRVVDARDRNQIYADGKFVATQNQTEIGDDVEMDFKDDKLTLDIMVENMGRVKYGHNLTAPTQSNGLGRGAMADL